MFIKKLTCNPGKMTLRKDNNFKHFNPVVIFKVYRHEL